MFPELGSIGPFTLYSFGLIVALGLVVAGWFLGRDIDERGMDPALGFEIMIAAAIGGLVGARVYWVIDNGSSGEGIFSSSGLTWYGGVIGGALAVVGVSILRKRPLGLIANLAAPGLAIGQAIGRIACQVSGDGDYGIATSLPWGMSYRNGVVPTADIVHPAPLYESVALLVIFMVLWRLRGRMNAPWSLFGLYLALSGTMRFFVEFVRRNPVEAVGLTVAQFIALASVVIGAAILVATSRGAASATAGGKPLRSAAR
ncbi:MAG: prolipoprotein diacylglyceryl transferase [Actinobacteria bacterium]|nr:prolipoprotein diacylglyceryl transferase [Actinomycetota bacterium]